MIRRVRSLVLAVVVLVVVACGASPTPVPTATPDASATAAAIAVAATSTAQAVQTEVARQVALTLTAAAPTATSTPTQTPIPTATPVSTATPTPIPATPTPSITSRIPPKGTYKHNLTIEVKYDNVRDSTGVILSQPFSAINATPNTIWAVYSVKGQKPGIPDGVLFEFESSSKSWQFLGVSRVDWLLNDSDRFSMPAKHDGTASGGGVLEYMAMDIPLDRFLTIVNASKIDVAISYARVTLSAGQMEALKDFASRMLP